MHACDLSYNVYSNLPKDKENIFFELLLPGTKPIVVGTIYLPPKQILRRVLLKTLNTNNVETYILGHFNTNLWEIGQKQKQFAFVSISPERC